MNLTPRYYQQMAYDAFLTYIRHNPGKHPLIVLPTAAGKSLIQAMLANYMLQFPDARVLLITHSKHLIKQNAEELAGIIGDIFVDVGIYSAGLNQRDTQNRILFAGIQSVYKKAWELGHFDLILVDEAHLISHEGEGMYRTFLAEMFKINPEIVIGGLTATAFRLKHGLLTEGEGAIFDDICYEATIPELIDHKHFKNKDNKQYLCELRSKNGVAKVDLTGVKVQGGEYNTTDMQKAFKENDLVCQAVKEIIEYSHDRKKVLIFTAGIEHCEEITQKIIDAGFLAKCVHSKQGSKDNEQILAEFSAGEFKFLVNVNTLTTGYNEKGIDCIVLLRSTMSPGLLVQMCGRGFRLFETKDYCLILDFGRNIERHGPIDKITVRKKKNGKGYEIATMPTKECPNCHSPVALSVMVCPDCMYAFPASDKHEAEASNASVLSEWKKPEQLLVTDIHYSKHSKAGKPDSLRVDYFCGLDRYSEWICIEHTGFAKTKAIGWLNTRLKGIDLNIESVDEALEIEDQFRRPQTIIVDENEKFPRIIGQLFEDMEDTTKRRNSKKLEQEKQEIETLENIIW